MSFKVFIVTFVIQVLSGALICAVFFWKTPMSYNYFNEVETINNKMLELTELLKDTPKAESGPILDEFIHENDVSIAIYDLDSFIDGNKDPLGDFGKYTLKTRSQVEFQYPVSDEIMLQNGSFKLVFSDDPDEYVLRFFHYIRPANLAAVSIRDSIPLMAGLIVLVSLICSFIYSFLFARPVRKLSEGSRAMADLDFSRKFNSKRKDEIGDLARDLDRMSESLDENITALKNEIEHVRQMEDQKDMFFAAASHELKTPVTVLEGQIRGMIEGVGPYENREEYLSRALRSVKRIESLINEILTASRMQSSQEVVFEKTDMADIVAAKLEEAEDLFTIRDITVECELENDLFFSGNRELTGLALNAFISNAVFYSKEGATIKVNAQRKDGEIEVSIRNRDAHIDEKDLPHLFEPFYRSDASRSRRTGGSGLGLYLAKLIITKQGGECSLINDGADVLATVSFNSI